ncbi:MAG: hypothetical protein ACOYMV_14250, partial [Verrucomicrobiia bacterium]
NGSVADVSATANIVKNDGFTKQISFKASQLPAEQQKQFAVLQAAITADAVAGGWSVIGGEITWMGWTYDYQTIANPKAGEEGQPATVQEAIPASKRSLLKLNLTQSKSGGYRYTEMTSEQWPVQIRDTVLPLYAWVYRNYILPNK